MRVHTGCLVGALIAGCATQPPPPESWDGLNRVEQRGLDAVYALEGANLSAYKKILLDPVEVAFDKDWDARGGTSYLGDDVDPEKIRTGLAELFMEVFRRELETEGGYQLVDQPGPDVLRVRPGIVDLYINAPDPMAAGRSRTFVVDAGHMTLIAELRDSATNALLARAVDRREGSNWGTMQVANSVTNTAEARQIIGVWADSLRNALDRAHQKR